MGIVHFRLVSMVIFGYDARFIKGEGFGRCGFVILALVVNVDVLVARFVGIWQLLYLCMLWLRGIGIGRCIVRLYYDIT